MVAKREANVLPLGPNKASHVNELASLLTLSGLGKISKGFLPDLHLFQKSANKRLRIRSSGGDR